MDEKNKLLVVEDTFLIEGRGLVLLPAFSVPPGPRNAQKELIVVVLPDGKLFETPAVFELSHFKLTDPNAPMDRRWRVTVMLPGCGKGDVPVGSQIFASKALVSRLLGIS